MSWETVIGLEVHVQLLTQTKIFSGAASAYGAEPNSQACAIDLALPGVLPVLNQTAVNMAIKFGLAVDAKIAETSVFERKNYFYPDLPKGYQISQYQTPIVFNGQLQIEIDKDELKTIGITRAHLEEDAGKSMHEGLESCSAIDLNRAGNALLEIVSEPDLRSSKEAIAYLKTLHSLVKYLDICDGNMQEGSFRCDANVSVRKQGETKLGTRAEIKNVNSFKFVEKAINYEVARQIKLLESGKTVIQETRLYDSQKDETRTMRTKEEANDYRYFPDPDLLPLEVNNALIQKVSATLPELPRTKQQRFEREYELSAYEAKILTSSRQLADFFEEAAHSTVGDKKLTANFIIGEVLGALNKDGLEIEQIPITAKQVGKLVSKIADQTISGKIAKVILEEMWTSKLDPELIIEQKGLQQVTDTSAIEQIVKDVFEKFPNQLSELRSGKDKLFGFFVGQVMKESKGKANPEQVNKILSNLIGNIDQSQ